MSPAETSGHWRVKGEPQFVISRFSVRVVDANDDDVATIYGADWEQCLQRAALLVNISAALATATANKSRNLPLPGQRVVILSDNPNDTELKKDQFVTVIAEPADAAMFGADDGDTLWVEDDEGGQWALTASDRSASWQTSALEEVADV